MTVFARLFGSAATVSSANAAANVPLPASANVSELSVKSLTVFEFARTVLPVPAARIMISAPPQVEIVSLPAPDTITSAPDVPVIVSAPSVPTILSLVFPSSNINRPVNFVTVSLA